MAPMHAIEISDRHDRAGKLQRNRLAVTVDGEIGGLPARAIR